MTLRKKAGLGLALFVTLGFLALAGWHLLARHNLQKHKAALISEGEFLSLTQAWPYPLKADPERAATFSAALNRLKGGAVLDHNQIPLMRTVRFGRALAGSMLPEIRYYSISMTNTWADVLQELEDNREAMNVLRKCLDGSGLNFNLDYTQGFNTPVPHLAKVKLAAQAFWMAEALALHNRDLPSATTNLLAVLALSQVMQNDRLIISELVQIAIAHIGAAATWEALQAPGWTDASLKQLQEKWLSLNFVPPMRDSLTMERALNTVSMDELRRSPQKLADLMNPSFGAGLFGMAPTSSPKTNLMDFLEGAPGSIKTKGTHALWRYFWSYEDEVRCLQVFQVQLEALRQPNISWKAASTLLESRLQAMGINTSAKEADDNEFFDPGILQARTLFSAMYVGNNRNSIRRALSAETLKEIASTAIALKRFQLRNGSYPTNLTHLVPGFLPRPPVDRMDGEALRYRLEPDGTFTLYSIGTDGIDGGGKGQPAKTERPRGWTLQPDWVWPTLATPAEIEAFEAEQAQKNKPRKVKNSVPAPATTNSTR